MLACAVQITTGRPGAIFCSFANHSSPSAFPSMCRSSTMRSKRSSSSFNTATRPLSAVSTTCPPARNPADAAMRTLRWSSTMSIRIKQAPKEEHLIRSSKLDSARSVT